MNKTLGLIGTIVIHALVLFLVLLHEDGHRHRRKASEQNLQFVELISPTDRADESISTESEKPAVDSDGNPCAPGLKTYFGIGVTYDRVTGEVLTAPRTFSAWKSGIRIGDMLMNPNEVADGQGMIHVKVLRYMSPMEFYIRGQHICFKDAKLAS